MKTRASLAALLLAFAAPLGASPSALSFKYEFSFTFAEGGWGGVNGTFYGKPPTPGWLSEAWDVSWTFYNPALGSTISTDNGYADVAVFHLMAGLGTVTAIAYDPSIVFSGPLGEGEIREYHHGVDWTSTTGLVTLYGGWRTNQSTNDPTVGIIGYTHSEYVSVMLRPARVPDGNSTALLLLGALASLGLCRRSKALWA